MKWMKNFQGLAAVMFLIAANLYSSYDRGILVLLTSMIVYGCGLGDGSIYVIRGRMKIEEIASERLKVDRNRDMIAIVSLSAGMGVVAGALLSPLFK